MKTYRKSAYRLDFFLHSYKMGTQKKELRNCWLKKKLPLHIGCSALTNRILATTSGPGLPSEEERVWQARESDQHHLKRQISQYPSMIAGKLRAVVLEGAALCDCSVQRALQKDLKLYSRMAARNLS